MHLARKRRSSAAVVGRVALVAILCRVRLVLIGHVGEGKHQVLEGRLDRSQSQALEQHVAGGVGVHRAGVDPAAEFQLAEFPGIEPQAQLSTSVSQSRNGFWLLRIPWNWNCVSMPVPRMAATWSAAISAAPLPSPTTSDGSTNVASCAADDGPGPPPGSDPVEGSPYSPMARSS